MTVHFKKTSPLFRLCVAERPHESVIERGTGLHASDGHQAMFLFGQGGVCRVKYFDTVCQQQLNCPILGRVIFHIDADLRDRAMAVFRRL